MKPASDVHVPKKMNPSDLVDALTFPLVPLSEISEIYQPYNPIQTLDLTDPDLVD